MNSSAVSLLIDDKINHSFLDKWQKTVGLVTEIFNFSVVLIIKKHSDGIEVLACSENDNLGFTVGERIKLNTRQNYESILASTKQLQLSNIQKDIRWKACREAAAGFIAFLGVPILWPDGNLFGTICVLDEIERIYTDNEKALLNLCSSVITDALATIPGGKDSYERINGKKQSAGGHKKSEESIIDSPLLNNSDLKKGEGSVDINKYNAITQQYMFTDEKLRASESRLLRAQAMAHVGNWEMDVENMMYWASEETYRIYGVDYVSPYIDVYFMHALVLAQDRPILKKALAKLITKMKTFDVQYRIKRHNDGKIRFLHSVAELSETSTGKPLLKGVVQDISDYVNVEERLIESERRYKAFFENTSAVQLVVDIDSGAIMAANTSASRYYGYDSDRLTQMNFMELNAVTPDVELQNIGFIYNLKRNCYETVHRMSNGEKKAVAVFGGPIDQDDKKFVHIIVHDITDQKMAEEKLMASEARYRNLFYNNAAVQIIFDSRTGHIFDANSAACEYYEISQKDIQKKYIWDIDSLSKEQLKEKIASIAKKETNYATTRHCRGDGEVRDVEVYCGRVDVEGHVLIHAIVHDITERKKAETELAESEQRFRLFVESAPDSVFVLTNDKFAYVNKKTLDLFRAKSESDLIDHNVYVQFKSKLKPLQECINILPDENKTIPVKEETIICMDGSLLNVEVSAVPFRYQGKEGALVFMRDITKRKQMEREKENMLAQLQQKQKLESIGTLAGGVAHEINNPVTGIINYAQLINQSRSADDEIREFSGEIVHEGHRITEIVSSLLTFARQEKKTHSLAQISDIVTGTLLLTRTILRHDEIMLELDIEDDLPSIKCRSQQIQQVLMNMITNARDALNTKFKGFNEDKKIRIMCSAIEKDGRQWLRLVVEDYGTGIPADVMDKIFDPFFTTKPYGEGTGLGLSISHGIVREHHGELYFETELGEFTRAVMELPVDNGWTL